MSAALSPEIFFFFFFLAHSFPTSQHNPDVFIPLTSCPPPPLPIQFILQAVFFPLFFCVCKKTTPSSNSVPLSFFDHLNHNLKTKEEEEMANNKAKLIVELPLGGRAVG